MGLVAEGRLNLANGRRIAGGDHAPLAVRDAPAPGGQVRFVLLLLAHDLGLIGRLFSLMFLLQPRHPLSVLVLASLSVAVATAPLPCRATFVVSVAVLDAGGVPQLVLQRLELLSVFSSKRRRTPPPGGE